MNLLKLLLIALLGAAVSATTMPTMGKVLGFGHTAAYAQDSNASGNEDPGEEAGEQ